ncbi:MAG: hypothetical protein A2W22_00720 [Candidatus Levybacteria bacterium RBG_16_35_11]|nr:MAG: hypothetical protein A2W22_00720 [Candidatus Levybacteria bacterium RBG_16_35_11]
MAINKDMGKYVPFLVVLLIIAAFFLGSLTTKVSMLQGGTTAPKQEEKAFAPTQGAGPQQPDPNKRYDIDAGHFPVKGDKNAKITVIEFADFQCPFCEKWFSDAGTQLIKEYVDTGKASFAFRNYAFLGDESKWAAEASECANEQGKFWEMHDYLFKNQSGENQGGFSKENLKKFAAALGLNTTQFNSCLDTDKYAKAVDDDLAAGQKVSVSGTPTTFVNGKILVGAVPYAELKNLIDQELGAK